MTMRGPVPWPMTPPDDTDASGFDWIAYMRQFPQEALQSGSARRNLTRYNPLLFALIYFRKHLTSATTGEITFSDFHLDSCKIALDWAKPVHEPKQYRTALIAPRETGKSTWWFLILPAWAAAHGHVKFLAAYSDTATQAERHLETFRRELETNALLRKDFSELANPTKKQSTGRAVMDNHEMIQTRSGFIFAAKGIDSSTLGLKVGSLRPDLIILDDIEPGEATYSMAQKAKRLSTLQDVIMPLNLNARLIITGTVTMSGSIIHDLVNKAAGEDYDHWVDDENIDIHHALPIITTDTGTERSIWPAKWSLEFLKSIAHTRSFAKNFANQPVGADGAYWTENSIQRANDHKGSVVTYLSVDPAVTSKKTSDWTGVAVVSYIPPAARQRPNAHSADSLEGTCVVRYAKHVRMAPGPALREYVLSVLALYPETRIILVETNQGGEAWDAIFHDMPVDIETVHQAVSKEVRAAVVLSEYENGHVLHEGTFPDLENEQMTFPFGAHDDVLDSVNTAVLRIREQEQIRRSKKKPATHRQTTYA